MRVLISFSTPAKKSGCYPAIKLIFVLSCISNCRSAEMAGHGHIRTHAITSDEISPRVFYFVMCTVDVLFLIFFILGQS